MYEMSQRHPVWVAENHVNPCNSVGRSCATICISGVREYQYRNARGQVTGDR